MADNTTVNPGSAGDVIRTVDYGSAKRQVIIIGDDTTDAARVRIKNATPALTDYGMVVRALGMQLEDAAHADGDAGFAIWGVRNETQADFSGTQGDYTPFAVDRKGVVFDRPRTRTTYLAAYRLADATAGTTDLSVTLVANTNKQLATIYHTGSATKLVTLLQAGIIVVNNTALADLEFELRRLSATTAPATGNPAITPGPNNPAGAAAEATCLALPTTAGSLVAANSPNSIPYRNLQGITTAPTSPSGMSENAVVLYDHAWRDLFEPLTMRAATAEGYAISCRGSAATTLRFAAWSVFTEE